MATEMDTLLNQFIPNINSNYVYNNPSFLNGDLIANDSLGSQLANHVTLLKNRIDNIEDFFNRNPTFMSVGGYQGLANIMNNHNKSSSQIVKQMVEDGVIAKEKEGDFRERLENLATRYNVSPAIAGAALQNSFREDRGNMSRQAIYRDTEGGKGQTSIDSKAEDFLENYNKNKGTINNIIPEITNLEKARASFNGTYSTASQTFTQDQNDFNKYRYMNDDNPIKGLATLEIADSSARAARQFNTANTVLLQQIENMERLAQGNPYKTPTAYDDYKQFQENHPILNSVAKAGIPALTGGTPIPAILEIVDTLNQTNNKESAISNIFNNIANNLPKNNGMAIPALTGQINKPVEPTPSEKAARTLAGVRNRNSIYYDKEGVNILNNLLDSATVLPETLAEKQDSVNSTQDIFNNPFVKWVYNQIGLNK